MRRVAVVARGPDFRRIACAVAERGSFEPDREPDAPAGPATALVERIGRSAAAEAEVGPILSPIPLAPEDLEGLVADGELATVLGEASYERHTAGVHEIAGCHVLPGWMLDADVEASRTALATSGGSIADLPRRRGLVPPTAHASNRTADAFRPLVTTYGTVAYSDLDPTLFAAIAYAVMFGMMFGDVGHGLAIVAVGAAALLTTGRRISKLRPAGPFLVAAGLAAAVFGLLYGEAFGPTGLVPVLWLRPLDEPGRLLAAALLLGGVLLAATFAGAIANRWRAGGPAAALYDPSGVAGALLLAGVGGLVLGATSSHGWATGLGWVLGGAGVLLVFVGLVARAGTGPAGVAQAIIELFDTALRLGSNLVSFARLAAFGLTHAVLTEVVWDGSTALWGGGMLPALAAVVLFIVGNVLAFALGGLVAAVQALRLEYYELFSRLFGETGRPFAPWHVPTRSGEVP